MSENKALELVNDLEALSPETMEELSNGKEENENE